jgi:hypothetical protein
MATIPFGNRTDPTTRKFLCCLHNRTDTIKGRKNGLYAIEVYARISEGQVVGAEGLLKTRIINHLVAGCERNGYIERELLWWPWWWRTWSGTNNRYIEREWWWRICSGRIRMTPAGIELCNSIEEDGTSYCSKVPSYKD